MVDARAGEEAEEPPVWVTFRDVELAADLDGDGVDEAIVLRDRHLVVRAGGKGEEALPGAPGEAADGAPGAVLFETPPEWQVSDAFAADFDGDGAVELAFLLWKRGNYGSSRPFWVGGGAGSPGETDGVGEDAGLPDGSRAGETDGVGESAGDDAARAQQQRVRSLLRVRAATSAGAGDEGLTQHLFVYRWRSDGRLHPVWMSSRLGLEITRIELVGVGAGAGDCAPRGPRPCLRITSADGRVTQWAWLSWGFALVEEGVSRGVVAGAASASGAACSQAQTPAAGLTLLAVGDNIAHANVYEGAYDRASRAFDFAPLYEHVRGRVASHDVAAVCQETILVANPALRSSYPRFATPQSMGDALAGAGFNVVLGATNHAADQGPRAIEQTCAFWAREHPEVTLLGLHATPETAGAGAGAGRPAFVERGGLRLALFDATYGLNGPALGPADAWRVDILDEAGTAALLAGLAQARDEADLSVCFLHVGQEYQAEPTDGQRELVERAIDAGADVVICSHAHVLGPYGRVRTAAGAEGVVFFGLGNFVSGQCSEARTALGGAASLRIERPPGASRARVASFELLPLVCHADGLGTVAAYFLDDYTDELAAEHLASKLSSRPLTVAALRALVPQRLP